MSKKTKIVFVCVECNSRKVQAKAWVSLNDNKKIDFSLSENDYEEDYWCPNCEQHVRVDTKTVNIK